MFCDICKKDTFQLDDFDVALERAIGFCTTCNQQVTKELRKDRKANFRFVKIGFASHGATGKTPSAQYELECILYAWPELNMDTLEKSLIDELQKNHFTQVKLIRKQQLTRDEFQSEFSRLQDLRLTTSNRLQVKIHHGSRESRYIAVTEITKSGLPWSARIQLRLGLEEMGYQIVPNQKPT